MRTSNIVIRTLGQKPATCYNCGRTILAGTEVIDFKIGGKPRCVCPLCQIGNFEDGFAKKSTEVGDGSKRGKTTTKTHTIQVVCSNPITALDLRIAHGFSTVKLENGDFRCEYKKMTTCHKGGWLFDENGQLLDNYQMMVVNGTPVKTSREYHEVVEAQTWYDEIRGC